VHIKQFKLPKNFVRPDAVANLALIRARNRRSPASVAFAAAERWRKRRVRFHFTAKHFAASTL
jgi:hypothetical protein